MLSWNCNIIIEWLSWNAKVYTQKTTVLSNKETMCSGGMKTYFEKNVHLWIAKTNLSNFKKAHLWHWHRLWWRPPMVQLQHSELEHAEWSSWWSRSPGALPQGWRLNHPLGWGSNRSELACWSLGPCRPPSCKLPWDPQEGRWLW